MLDRLLRAYIKSNEFQKVIDHFGRIQDDPLLTDVQTTCIVMSACLRTNDRELLLKYYNFFMDRSGQVANVAWDNMILSSYVSYSFSTEAQICRFEVRNLMLSRNIGRKCQLEVYVLTLLL